MFHRLKEFVLYVLHLKIRYFLPVADTTCSWWFEWGRSPSTRLPWTYNEPDCIMRPLSTGDRLRARVLASPITDSVESALYPEKPAMN